jgi:hypothetical protein
VANNFTHLVVHCKRDKFDIYIGRGSKWGNDWSHLPNSAAKYIVATRDESIEKHKAWFLSQTELMKLAKKELKEKRLACFCRPIYNSCHGDILAQIANEE